VGRSVQSTIVHTEPLGAILLFDEDGRGSPGAVGWLYHPCHSHLQYDLQPEAAERGPAGAHHGPAGVSINGAKEVEAVRVALSANLVKVLDGGCGRLAWWQSSRGATLLFFSGCKALWCCGAGVGQ